jgi:hypothetical protein
VLHLIGLTLAVAAVLPLGAVLAGRIFGPALAGRVFGTALARRVFGTALARRVFGRALAGRVFGTALAGRVPGGGAGWARGRAQLSGGAESTVRSEKSIFISFIFFVAIAGYACAFEYSAAQAAAPGQDSALAGWLVAHGLRYGLGQPVTVQRGHRGQRGAGGGRAGRGALGAGGAVQYQSPAAAYDPRLHEASFLAERLPAGWSRGSAWTLPYPAVRATFGRSARSYRSDGYEVLVWNVNLLTRMGE